VNPEVLVVGAGPTGLVSAILLGSSGVRTLVVERNPATSDEPKAVTIDDIALRTLQRAGVAEAIYPAIFPGTGTKYYGRRGQLLAYARGAWPPRNGHPVKNPLEAAFAEENYRTLPVGDWRIIYVARDDELLVLVIKIGHRGDVYRAR
jgi:hypothetical protein